MTSFSGIIGVDVKEAAEQMNREEHERLAGKPLEQSEKLKTILKAELERPKKAGYSHIESLTAQNLVLRGTRLENTHAAVGFVVFAGSDTKVSRNWLSAQRPTKRSHLMKLLDRTALILLGVQLFLAVLSAIGNALFLDGHTLVNDQSVLDAIGVSLQFDLRNMWHMRVDNSAKLAISWTWFFFMYANVLSVSIWLTLELVKASQGSAIRADPKMWDVGYNLTYKSAMVTSNVNADLGQIEHVFSDNTGILSSSNIQVARILTHGVEYCGVDSTIRTGANIGFDTMRRH